MTVDSSDPSPDTKDRSDGYDGSLANRYRIVHELIDVARDAVAGKVAAAVRYATSLTDLDGFDAFGTMAELPDLWDLNVHRLYIHATASR